MRFYDPVTGAQLARDTPHSFAADGTRWPVAGGIPYLRAGHEALRDEALAALDAGDETAALVLLLADHDGVASAPPPSDDTLSALIASDASFREAMATLNFGPAADYYAHRWSAPTFLSGVALAALYAPREQPFIEVCCGTGQLLRELAVRGYRTAGVDRAFSKLWLGRRYLSLETLVCADAEALPVTFAEGGSVMIHDALHLIADADKPLVVAAMARSARSGAVLAGHCHVADRPCTGEVGSPLSPAEWHGLLPDAALLDDTTLTEWFVSMGTKDVTLLDPAESVAAVALAAGPRVAMPVPVWVPALDLSPNPLLGSDGNGGLMPHWPSETFASAYADAHYLASNDRNAEATLPTAVRHARRSMIPLPPRW